MDKKGFTLVEIIVSISLISIVLVSMLVTLVNLRQVYSESNDDTDIRIYGSSLSRAINKDILENKGIKTVECEDNTKCNITLNNDETRVLLINTLGSSEKLNALGTIKTITNKSTIIYKNTYKTPLVDTDDQIITIKTVTSVTTQSVDGDDILYEDTEFFHFTGLTHKEYDYTVYKIHKISINASDPRYTVNIYSGI